MPALCEACDGEGVRELYGRRGPRQGSCPTCSGRGILKGTVPFLTEPRVAIVGGGLAGLALAVALQHRGIPCRVYEKDPSLDARHQGYALTLQQGSVALQSLGVEVTGASPHRHASFDSSGTLLGCYERPDGRGARSKFRPANIVLPRNAVRTALFDALSPGTVLFDTGWDFGTAEVVVAADGVSSGDTECVGFVVVLGRCPASAQRPWLQGATWQAVNGETRIYVMPYEDDVAMWQLSWPCDDKVNDALTTSLERVKGWFRDVTEVVASTRPEDVVSYALRSAVKVQARRDGCIAIGDAAHAMTPFKGQGANQSLLDALDLARTLRRVLVKGSCREDELEAFARRMEARVQPKLDQSRQAARLLHSPAALAHGDEVRADAARRTLT